MSGIQYIVNSKGKRTGVIISLREYGALFKKVGDAYFADKSPDEQMDWEEAKRMMGQQDRHKPH